jgi:hypothetical protein
MLGGLRGIVQRLVRRGLLVLLWRFLQLLLWGDVLVCLRGDL